MAAKRRQNDGVQWISATDAAKRLGLTSQAVGQWASKPNAPAKREGTRTLVQWPQFARWREAALVESAVKESMPGDLDAARTRKANAEAELAELEVAKARGEFVSVADYETALARVLDRLMARLRSLPVRLSHLGAEAEAAAEVEVERVVTELNAFDEDVLDEPGEEPEQERAA